jgi:hypothetical protein
MIASAISSDLPVGSSDLTSGRGRRAGRTAVRAVGLRRAGTRTTSAPAAALLQGRQLERAEEAHLVLEDDPELLVHPATRLGHQRDRVGGGGTAGVLDEVRVQRRDDRAADPDGP